MNVIETPSGKGAGDENFPVGSLLLPKRLRPAVAAYYDFARAIDDIADNPRLSSDDKIARLEIMRAALEDGRAQAGTEKADRAREAMLAHGAPLGCGADLIAAFKQDAVKTRYADWAELMDYCDRSAAPVGRFLVHIHGEADDETLRASDALCKALQVLNHLQDCGEDRREMDRVYLPEPWLEEAGGGVADLDGAASSPALRGVIDRCLDGVDGLLADARGLAPRLADRRFAMEAHTIVRLARRLAERLRIGDPLATRVALSKADFAVAVAGGIWTGLFGARAAAGPSKAREASSAAE